jgi:GNAT superfamily N-acetyltransferase
VTALSVEPVLDRSALEAFHLVEAAAQDHDFVALPADPLEEWLPLLETPERAGERVLLWLGRAGGEPVASLSMRLPTLDNLTTASLDLHVHPAHRRRGHGRAMVAEALGLVRGLGRSRVFFEVPSGADGTEAVARPLMDEIGAKPVLDDHRRLLDLTTHPAGERAAPPDGYRVVQWVDRVPEELLDGVAYLSGRMVLDAPLGEMAYEQEKWDAARYRDKEVAAMERGRTRVATAVVHDSGAVAGATDIGVNQALPEVAYQWDTIVDPAHRGQRLGLVLKTWNHAFLVEQVPAVRFVNTWNATSNSFMIAVNDQLGFRPVEKWTEYQLDL